MTVTLNRALMLAGLVLFIIAALLGFDVFGDATLPQLVALTDTGLACWLAGALV